MEDPLPAADHDSSVDPVSLTLPLDPAEVDPSLEANYQEVVGWIQTLFPDEPMHDTSLPPRARSMIETLLDSHKDTPARLALPLSRGCVEVIDEAQRLLKGDSSRKSSLPYKKGKLLPHFEFPTRFYHLPAHPKIETKVVNPLYEQLVPTSSRQSIKKPPIESSVEEVLTQELSAYKNILLSSSLDWQLTTGASLLQQFLDQHPEFPDLQKITRIL